MWHRVTSSGRPMGSSGKGCRVTGAAATGLAASGPLEPRELGAWAYFNRKMLDSLRSPAQEMCVPGHSFRPLRSQLLLSQMKMLKEISSRNLSSQGLVEVWGDLVKLLHTAPSWHLTPAAIVPQSSGVPRTPHLLVHPSIHHSIHPFIIPSIFPSFHSKTLCQMICCLCPKRKLTKRG